MIFVFVSAWRLLDLSRHICYCFLITWFIWFYQVKHRHFYLSYYLCISYIHILFHVVLLVMSFWLHKMCSLWRHSKTVNLVSMLRSRTVVSSLVFDRPLAATNMQYRQRAAVSDFVHQEAMSGKTEAQTAQRKKGWGSQEAARLWGDSRVEEKRCKAKKAKRPDSSFNSGPFRLSIKRPNRRRHVEEHHVRPLQASGRGRVRREQIRGRGGRRRKPAGSRRGRGGLPHQAISFTMIS